jgi:hypothetical protein
MKLYQIQIENKWKRVQKEKIQKFIEISQKSWKKVYMKRDRNPDQKSQENQLEDQSIIQDHQKAKKYMFRRIRPPRDKRLLHIDKLKHRYWILLIRIYLVELSPNHKQKRFVSWFRRRKSRPRLKQKERETILSFDKGNELNYLN